MSSSSPATPETRQRILDAAIRCVQQWGIDKTSLNDIAREAGVTRPTVYNHFANRDAVVQAALLQSGHAFAERVKQHIAGYPRVEDKLLEALVYAFEELPREPYLALIMGGNITRMVNETALTSAEGMAICVDIFATIFDGHGEFDAEMPEIIEFSIRVLLSFLLLEGPQRRNRHELRDLLQRRLLPGLGLGDPR